MPDPVADATAQPMPVDTQSAPVQGNLQPPAPTPSPAPNLSAADVAPHQSWFTTMAHSVAGAVLGVAAARDKEIAPPSVAADGTMQPAVTTRATTGDQLRQMARSALTGLAAGARIQQQKSGVATALAGLGAGADDAIQRGQDKDLLERKQAGEDWDRQQGKIVQQHDIARGNALMYSQYSDAMQKNLDHDTERQSNIALAKAAEDAGIPVKYLTADEAVAMAKSTPGVASSHMIRPIGYEPMMDVDGKPLTNADGTPRMQGKMAFIPGLSDDKIKIPQSFADDAKKYGSIVGVSDADGLQAGHEIPLSRLAPLEAAIQEGRKAVANGWMKPDISWGGDNHDIPMATNLVSRESRPFIGGIIPQDAAEGAAKTSLYKAQADEARDKGKESLANASQLLSGTGSGSTPLPQVQEAMKLLHPATQSLLTKYSPDIQAAIISVANGDTDLKAASNRVKGVINQLQLAGLAQAVHQDMTGQPWSEALYPTKQSLYKDFAGGGDDGDAIASFNQFLGHAGELSDVVHKFSTTQSPMLNKPINWLRSNMDGDPAVTQLITALTPVQEEYFSFLKKGQALHGDEVSAMKTIMSNSSNPSQIYAAIKTMVPQAITRLDQLNEKWRTVDGRNYPNLVTPSGKDAATKLGFGDKVAKYGSGGTLGGGAPQQAPPTPSSHVFNSAAWQQTHPGEDVEAAKTYAKSQGYEVK